MVYSVIQYPAPEGLPYLRHSEADAGLLSSRAVEVDSKGGAEGIRLVHADGYAVPVPMTEVRSESNLVAYE
jgi:hypothetical protein